MEPPTGDDSILHYKMRGLRGKKEETKKKKGGP